MVRALDKADTMLTLSNTL